MKNENDKFFTREEFYRSLEEDRRRWESYAAEDRKRWEEHIAEDRKKWDEHVRKWDDHLRKWDEHVAEDRKKWEEHIAEDRRKWENNQKVIHRMLAQLSRHGDFIGFGVEGLAAVLLPPYLENAHNLRIKQLKKEVISINGKQIEINLFGSGKVGRKKIAVLVECKATIGKKSIEGFLKKLRVIEPYLESQGMKVIRIVFGPLILPEAAVLARSEGIEMVSSVPQNV